MRRLTDNDRRWGPFTWGPCGPSWRPLRLVFSTGGGDDECKAFNSLTAYAFGWVMRLRLPTLMQPFRIKHIARTWDAATVARMGRNWYYETFPREYGFSLNEGFLQIFLGPQTHDSTTTKSWCKHLPWTQWRHVRHSFYGLDGAHFWTEPERASRWQGGEWEEMDRQRSACPQAHFAFTDYDGEQNAVSTRIEEMEWRFGTGWFKWLSLFRKPKIHRTLNLEFFKEVGPEKGSWEGGTLGHGIDMLPGEDHEGAFRRYCEQDHRSKYRSFRITFVGPCEKPVKPARPEPSQDTEAKAAA